MTTDDDPRRTLILDAAGEVFCSKGFEAATTLEIARLARVSKRDLYRLFASKQGILDALIGTHTQSMIVPPELGRPDTATAFLETLRVFGRQFLAELLQERRVALYRLAIAESARSTRLSEALQQRGTGLVRESARAFVAHAIGRGIVAPGEGELVMTTYFDVLIGSLQTRRLLGVQPMPDPTTIAAQADRAVTVVQRLIAGGSSGTSTPAKPSAPTPAA